METDQAISRKLTVQNQLGIHARPAAQIVRITSTYPETEVWVSKGEENVNAKSIMGLMMLAAGQGTELEFSVTGPGAEELLDKLEACFAGKFSEE